MAEPRTETQQLEDRIAAALVTIRREWPAMMPKGAPVARLSNGGADKAAGIVGDTSTPWYDDLGRPHWPSDHARGGGDVDPTTRLLALRREVVEVLNGWCRVVIEDRPVTKALPADGMDAHELTTFLERHAAWMSGHEAARDCADEVAVLANQVEAVTTPRVKEWVGLGSCPLQIEAETEDGLAMVTCGGQVRAWPKPGDRDGQVMARCRRCGQEAVSSWWESRMFDDDELSRLLTYDGVAMAAHRVLGRPVQRATVKMWANRGIITPLTMRDEKGRTLFAREATVRAIHVWAGLGDMQGQEA